MVEKSGVIPMLAYDIESLKYIFGINYIKYKEKNNERIKNFRVEY